jgi:hypothetical protein
MSLRARVIPLFCLAPLLAGGCTMIDQHERVAGWPDLRLVEHYVPEKVMRERCAKYVPFGFLPEACAEFYFAQGECHVWYSADYPPTHYVMEHERLHCRGFDHPGDTNLRDVLARYEAGRRPAGVGATAGKAPRG